MGDVVSIKPKEQGIWFCNCDSYSFKLRQDGIAVCLLCGVEHSGKEDGAWSFPPLEGELKECPDDPRVTTECGTVDLALRRVINHIDADKTSAVIVLQAAGTVHTWGAEFETKAQRTWLGRKLRLARGLLQHI